MDFEVGVVEVSTGQSQTQGIVWFKMVYDHLNEFSGKVLERE